MDYDVVCVEGYITLSCAIEKLREKVKSKIEEGWQVQGGISIACEEEDVYSVAQAIVKADIQPEPEEAKEPTVIQL